MREPIKRVWARENDFIEKEDAFRGSWAMLERIGTRVRSSHVLQKETQNAFHIGSKICETRKWEWPWAMMEMDANEEGVIVTPRRVLDIGCGFRPFTIWLRDQGHSVMGVDDMSWSTKEDVGMLLGQYGCGFVETDARRLPFPPQSFDYAFCISVLEHEEPAAVASIIREGCRVSRKLFIVTVDSGPSVQHLLPEEPEPEDVIRTGGGNPVAGLVFKGGF